MQSRAETIWEALKPFIEERRKQDYTLTQTAFESHAPRLIESLKAAMLSCDEQAAAYRQKGEKDETAFIAASFLDSSVIIGAYDLRIDFYDREFLSDIAESCAYFSYVHLIPFYEESVDAICAKATEEFVRFMDYEKDALAYKYRNDILYQMALTTYKKCLEQPEIAEFLTSLSVVSDFAFTFGRFMRDQEVCMRISDITVAP